MQFPLIAGIEEFPALKRAYEQAMRAAGSRCRGCIVDDIVTKYQQMLVGERQRVRSLRGVRTKYPGIHN